MSRLPIRQLDFGGEIHYRIQGEHHNWNPDTIYKLQHASRSNDPKTYAEFAQLVNDESQRRSNLRGLLDFKFAAAADSHRRSGTGEGDRQAFQHRAPCRSARSARKRTRRWRSR